MKDSEPVGGLESVGNLDSDRKHQLQAGRAAGDELIERLARHVLHDNEALVAVFAHFIDGADVGMLNGRGETGLTQDRGAQLLGGKQAGAQNLQDYRALEQGVVGQVDYAGAPGSQAALNLVMFDHLSLHGCLQV
jgi:hypothetical protein